MAAVVQEAAALVELTAVVAQVAAQEAAALVVLMEAVAQVAAQEIAAAPIAHQATLWERVTVAAGPTVQQAVLAPIWEPVAVETATTLPAVGHHPQALAVQARLNSFDSSIAR